MDYWGGGGGKGYVGPPSQIIGGPGPPSSYACAFDLKFAILMTKDKVCRLLN